MVRMMSVSEYAFAVSVARTRKLAEFTATVGIPLIVPFENRVSPAGGELPTVLHVYDPVPPYAVRVCEYAMSTVPAGSGKAVVMIMAELLIARVKSFSAYAFAESVTRIRKAELVAAEGDPMMIPVGINNRPAGRLPLTRLQLYGPDPPLAVSVCE
jgi:hypothetical protein